MALIDTETGVILWTGAYDEELDGILVKQQKIARDMNPEEFDWRRETYEFVSDRLAIDLLAGSDRYRHIVEGGGDVDEWVAEWEEPLREFARTREEFLLYRSSDADR